MINPKTFLSRLHQNLNLLREREAKYGSNAPLDLLNQIADHEAAIALTKQAIRRDISETKWLTELQSLLIAGNHWQEISLAVMLVLAQYTPDKGRVMEQAIGPPASEQAGEITSFVLAQVAEVDPRTAQKYPQNPAGYDAPLNDTLDELLAANQTLVDELKTKLEKYQQLVQQASPDRPDKQASLTGTGSIAQGKGATATTATEGGLAIGSAGGDVNVGVRQRLRHSNENENQSSC
jgi:hypothetical protein